MPSKLAKKKITPCNYVAKYLTVTLADGSKKTLKFYGKTENEAIKKRDTAKIKYAAGILTFNDNTTFARWAEEWFETCQKVNTGDARCKNIHEILKRFFLPTLGSMHLYDIKLTNIRRCTNLMEGKSEDYIS